MTLSSEKMFRYTLEVEKRNSKLFQDFRGSHEKGATNMNREVLVIKNQLEEMTASLREITMIVKNLSERSSESSSSPGIERRGRHKRSIDVTTVTDFNGTSPELEATETSTQSSPEPSNRPSRQETLKAPDNNESSLPNDKTNE
jgi:hypothetical protein